MMKSRKRVLKALSHEEPDRVPIDLGSGSTTLFGQAYDDLKKYMGVNKPTRIFCRGHADPDEEILKKFGVDTRYIRVKSPVQRNLYPDNSYYDPWGVKWKKPDTSYYFDIVDSPLKRANIATLKGYPWPDACDAIEVANLREEVESLHQTGYAVVLDEVMLGIFEMSWALRGFENFLIDLMKGEKFARVLLEKVTEIQMNIFEAILREVRGYIDIVIVTDDLGTQQGPLISPSLYRKLIKPFHRYLWQFIKEKSNAYLCLHSCGSVFSFISDFISLGVDILNPIQVTARDMDTKKLKREFGSYITFWGANDAQKVLLFGSAQDIYQEARIRIRDLGPGGGYVFGPSHNIQPGVKPINVCTLYETALKYGKYPIEL